VHQRFASRLSARDLKELSRICERLYGDEVAPAAPAPASRPRRGA
jgi:hypothetical protein